MSGITTTTRTSPLEHGAQITHSNTLIKTLAFVSGVLLFSGLTYVGANIRIPLIPVPITLQTLFVLLAGAMLSTWRGSLSQLLYVGGGLFGLPLFAGHIGGLAVLTGPTGGYIVGFVIAPILIGAMISKRSSFQWSLLVFSLGTLVIWGLGILHLTIFYTHNLTRALAVGAFPFVPGAAFKIFAAASIYRSYNALRGR